MNFYGLKEKTIRMPTQIANDWIDGLRSGKYNQGTGELESCGDDKCFHCCLGVLQMVTDGECQRYPNMDGTASLAVPTQDWALSHGIELIGLATTCGNDFNPLIGYYDDPFHSLEDDEYEEEKLKLDAVKANDCYKLSFNEIADLLECCIEKV